MEQFVIPLNRFDLGLLPEAARDMASPSFREAVDDYFRRRFQEMDVNGVVQLTGDTLTVGWAAPDFDPVTAAIALCQRGQVRDGVQLLELARSRQRDSPDLLLNLGIGLNELGEGQRAVTVLENLLDLEPDHIRGLVALGVALGRLGDDDAALDRFTRAVFLAQADPWTQSNLGGMLLRVGRPDEARPHLETAVQLAPENPRGWLLLGESCLESGDESAARTALGRARALDPHGQVRDRADALLNRLACGRFPRNLEGINPEALAAMTWALGHLRSLSRTDARNLTLKAALLGQHGLRLTDTAKAHRLEGIPEPLTALQVACLIHAGLQMAAPGTPSGFPLEREHQLATASRG